MNIDLIQLEFIDKNLRLMVQDVENHFGVEFTITSLYRIDDNGVHGALPLRGVDLRCKVQQLGKMVEEYINSNYRYDPNRPNKKCCIFHNTGQGWHLHLQTHPATIMIN